ncbi:MAG: permease-like cell division protein FtsX [Clostridia bacterium]|nr:permease-like cell division protein FtsX [Clostridia bacterium]
MRRYSLFYFISESFKGLFRNGVMTVASILVLMSCLTVMGSFALLVDNINLNLNRVSDLNEAVVFCDADWQEVAQIGEQLRSLDNVDSSSVEFISRQQAFEEEKAKYSDYYADLFDAMEARGDNPYPDCYKLRYKSVDDIESLRQHILDIDGVSKVKIRDDLAKKLENLKNTVIMIFMWFLVILFIVSIFVIINTIKLAVFARRQEITVMRYVGAANWFITLPFIFEGILIGLISSGLAYLIEQYGYRYVQNIVIKNYGIINVVQFTDVWQYVAIGFVAIGVVTGIIGSCISLSKYLKA